MKNRVQVHTGGSVVSKSFSMSIEVNAWSFFEKIFDSSENINKSCMKPYMIPETKAADYARTFCRLFSEVSLKGEQEATFVIKRIDKGSI